MWFVKCLLLSLAIYGGGIGLMSKPNPQLKVMLKCGEKPNELEYLKCIGKEHVYFGGH